MLYIFLFYEEYKAIFNNSFFLPFILQKVPQILINGGINILNDEISIKDIQAIQYEILLEFDSYCRKKGIKYFLFAGTLLGAVRHNNFIPWDDDIDICMTRSEYDKFINLSKKGFANGYFVQNKWSDPNFFKHYTKIRKDKTLFIQNGYRFLKIHHGISISVFPLDNFKQTHWTSVYRFITQNFYRLFIKLDALRAKSYRSEMYKTHKNKVYYCFDTMAFYLLKLFPKRTSDALMDKLFTIYKSNYSYLNHLTNGMTKERVQRFKFKQEYFKEETYCLFRNNKFPIPIGYHEILTQLYDDYMKLPPENERIPKHNAIEIRLNTNKYIGDKAEILE